MIENSETYELDYYYDISTWDGYREMMTDPIKVNGDWRWCFDKSFKKDEREIL